MQTYFDRASIRILPKFLGEKFHQGLLRGVPRPHDEFRHDVLLNLLVN